LLIRLVYDKNTSPYRFTFKFGVKFENQICIFMARQNIEICDTRGDFFGDEI